MKKKSILIMMISLSLVLLFGTSYALLKSQVEGSNPYVMNVGNFEVIFDDSKTKDLTISNMYPMSDEEGKKSSDELTFVVKNGKDVEATYNVYIKETSTNPEFKNYIRFISNKNDLGYNEPKTLGYDKYIDKAATLQKEESATYKVKLWLSKDADNKYMDKEFKAKLIVEGSQVDKENFLVNKLKKEINSHPNTTIVEDEITYLTGSREDVNYNYVWYSGKLWRVTSINPDDTIKMATAESVTSIEWDDNSSAYKGSYVEAWLNEEFLPTLYNLNNLIVLDFEWNNTKAEDYTKPIPETTMVEGAVGLLNVHEYYQSIANLSNHSKGYLGFDTIDNTLTPTTDLERYLLQVGGAFILNSAPRSGFGIRPAVILKSNVVIKDGTGTSEDPYILDGDKDQALNSEKLNERLSGEYVKFNNAIYRIVSIEKDNKQNKITKLISFDYLKDAQGNVLMKKLTNGKPQYGISEKIEGDYWDYYLNNTWYNQIDPLYKNMMVKSNYYLETGINSNYKNTICADLNTTETTSNCKKTSKVWNGYVGLPRLGEMFASQNTLLYSYGSINRFWLVTPYDSVNNRIINSNDYVSMDMNNDTYNYVESAARPMITLTNDVIITSGDGKSPTTAYEIALS